MDKNIAAILRKDTKTVGVTFDDTVNGRSKAYTYVTHLDLAVGDTVIVPAGQDEYYKMATIARVDDDLEIEPNATTYYRWVVCKVDFNAHFQNMERNREIERQLATAYRTNARQAYAQQFLSGASPEVIALINGKE
jgi:hypothetical protein